MARRKKARKPLGDISDAEVAAYLARQNDKLAKRAPAPICNGTTDAEVIAAANRDRAEDLGRYGMTSAMREEQRRMDAEPSRGVRDDWA